MKTRLFAILIAACALVACKRPPGQAAVPGPAVNQDAIKVLGSTVPEPNYDHSYWLKQHDANTPEWQKAKRLCEQTVLANYPNCLPVNDIVQADQLKKARPEIRLPKKSKRCFGADINSTTYAKLGCLSARCKQLDAPIHIRKLAKRRGNARLAQRSRRAFLIQISAGRESEMPPTQFGIFQDVLSQFQAVTATWLGGLYGIGTNLFYMLATMELILVGVTGTLRRDFDQLAIDLVRTIAGVMAMFTLFRYGPDFLQNGVILSFTGWASVTGHVPASAMTPGGVMTQGF